MGRGWGPIIKSMMERFSLSGQVVLVTGGAGLLGLQHALAIAEAGGLPVILDSSKSAIETARSAFESKSLEGLYFAINLLDVAAPKLVEDFLSEHGLLASGLVNNVASNPPMFSGARGVPNQRPTSQTEDFGNWQRDLDLSLGVASRFGMHFGQRFAEAGGGSIVNIASDLALIAPDHRIYEDPNDPSIRPKKALSYAVTKAGILGLSRYLATYWSPIPVRSNALAIGSVKAGQDELLERNLKMRIPLGRLAFAEEYQGVVVFLLSEASSYMTGSVVTLDGGRSIW